MKLIYRQIFFFFCIFGTFCVSLTQAEYFTIDSFHSDIVIHDNGSLRINEKIAVDFWTPRHGIFREIPERYESSSGYYQIFYNVQSLNHPYISYSNDPRWFHDSKRISSDNHSFIIQIGDPDLWVDGTQTYDISYTASPGVKDYGDHQELYRNILGERPVDMKEVSFQLSLPSWLSGYTFASGDIALYAGSYGSQETIPFVYKDSKISSSLKDIPLHSTITVAIKFASGTWQDLTTSEHYTSIPFFTEDKRDSFGIILAAAIIPLRMIFSFILKHIRRWRNALRKRGSDSLIVQYYPPEGLTPIEGGYIDNDQFDPREIVATLYDRAIRGYVRINETEKQGIIKSTSYITFSVIHDPTTLKPLEQELWQRIFKDKREFSFNGKTKGFFDKIADIVQKYSEQSYYQRGGLLAGIESNDHGIALYRHLRGYRQFLKDVEHDKLKTMLASDPLYIEKCLPRAIIFGTETQLTKAAEGLAIDPPTWYYGRNYMMYRIISNSISSGQSSYSHAVHASSSGFGGGGGFSGGGGGGGGGGSW